MVKHTNMEYHCKKFTQFTYSNIVTNDLGMTLYQKCSNCIILQEMAILSGASFFLSIKRKTKSWKLFLACLFFEINLFNAYYCKVSVCRCLDKSNNKKYKKISKLTPKRQLICHLFWRKMNY